MEFLPVRKLPAIARAEANRAEAQAAMKTNDADAA
jgi:hypothetical protein